MKAKLLTRLPFRKRWTAAIVGMESGNVTELSFLAFRTIAQAREWVARANQGRPDNGLTRYVVWRRT
jgi:hypothetical protein